MLKVKVSLKKMNVPKMLLLKMFAVLFILDSIYLFAMKNYFQNQIKRVQGSSMELNIYASIGVYILIVFGIYYFIIREKKTFFDAFLLGIVIYGIYELTSLALLKEWSIKTVIMDSLWGGILFGLTTMITYKLTPIR